MSNQNLAIAPVSTYDKVQDPMSAATQLGEWIARSGMFGCEKLEQGSILALQCLVERKAPLELAKHYHIIGGKLSLRADAMLALYRERGGKVKWIQHDDLGAKARWVFDGNDIELAYTAEEAKRAGFLPARAGSGWAKFPAEMMRARLISKAVRMLAPEVVTGTYTPEELEDTRNQPSTQLLTPVAPVSAVKVEVLETIETLPSTPEKTMDQVIEENPVVQLIDLLASKGLMDQATQWLKSKKWLEENQQVIDLAPVRVKKIMAKPDQFLAAIQSEEVK